MTKYKLTLATRKWKRQFNQAVASSIAKTITEPVTNSYDSYKRKSGEANTGLVDRILALGVGTELIHGDLVAKVPKGKLRTIRIRLSTTGKAASLEKRECQVIDNAEGMSADEMESKFEKYGAEKSGLGAGHAVRGLFGQGICDVLYSHQPGQIRSIKDDRATACDFLWEGPAGAEEPIYEVSDLGKAVRRHRKDWGLTDGNGTNVSFVLDEICRVPSPDVLFARLSGFYMLRLINADPATTVVLEQTRAKDTLEQPLAYNFPRGQVIGRFSVSVPYETYAPITADIAVVRAETSLPGREAGDDRANGLLVVDEADTVYDQTLFGFEASPYLDQIYGVVRLTGVREIIRDRLNKGEALLTESRDGFDPKSGLYKALEETLTSALEPTLRKEIERRSEPSRALSEVAEKRVRKALQKLNELFEDVTKKNAGPGPGPVGPEVPSTLEFEEKRVQLRIGQGRRIRLVANAARFKKGSPVIVDSSASEIRIEPNFSTLEPTTHEEILAATFSLSGSALGATSHIVALAQDLDGEDAEAPLDVTDVTLPEITEPPKEGLEFRPKSSHSAPSRLGSLTLLVNPSFVPVGTEISVRRASGDAAVKLVDGTGTDVNEVTVRFTTAQLLPGGKVGRIGLSYRGYGYGQKARITADCFPAKKVNVRAEVWVSIEETKTPSGGVFREVQYGDLPGGFATHASEFDPYTGVITVNRLHSVNRAAFGQDKKTFRDAVDNDKPAQFRLAEVVIDTCLFHMLAVGYRESEVVFGQDDPVGDIRKAIEHYKNDVEEDVFRQFVDGFKVPKLGQSASPSAVMPATA